MKQKINFSKPQHTESFATVLSTELYAGDVILLFGEIGVGKSTFARAFIQNIMAVSGQVEDVPSPTFTLVQTYNLAQAEIWHADLYRLTHIDELTELGLEEAFETAVCLVEWADRLGTVAPTDALHVRLTTIDDQKREMELEWSDPKWDSILRKTLKRFDQVP